VYYEAPFAEKMLKDHLHETLKESTMGNSNEEGLKQTTLKCNDVLEQMKATNNHASKKI
jgi:DNA-binding FrmR family transcriptional regulator